jgi:hypothetical protein
MIYKYQRHQQITIIATNQLATIQICTIRNDKPFYYVQAKPKDYHIGVYEDEITF